MKKPKIYIAGPMSGYTGLNWDAFDQKELELISAGWDVVNPAGMDREMGIDPNGELDEYDYEDAAGRDIEALKSCDAIYMMAGFQYSKGACWERALAKHWGLPRYYEIPRADHEFPIDREPTLFDNVIMADGYSASDDIRMEHY